MPRVLLRAVTAGDFLSIDGLGDVALARRRLVQRCVLAVDGRAGPPPDALEPQIEAELEALDPQADVTLALNCPACAEAWEETFDPPLVL